MNLGAVHLRQILRQAHPVSEMSERHRKIGKCQDRTQPEQTVLSVLFLTSISKRAKMLDCFLDVQYILRTSWSCPCANAEPCLPDLTSFPGESSSDL